MIRKSLFRMLRKDHRSIGNDVKDTVRSFY